MPEDEAGVRAALLGLVERAIGRLTERAAAHAERAAAEAAERAVRLGFDAGTEGERLRRYQFGCERSLKRSLDTLMKLRRGGGVQRRTAGGDEPRCPTPPAAQNEATTPRGTEILPVSDVDGPETPVAPAPDSQPPVPNEATAAMAPIVAQPSVQNEASTPAVDHPGLQNEASIPAVDHSIIGEAGVASFGKGLLVDPSTRIVQVAPDEEAPAVVPVGAAGVRR